MPEHVATLLAQISCDGQALPQGSPCSPVISNLVAHAMDMHIVRLAARVGCTYTRYADDLTFSTNKKAFPPEIAVPSETEPHVWLLGSHLQEIIDHSDFRVNASKTRMQYRDSRQDVTGLVVNQKINIRREYRHTVRAMVHRLFSTGTFEICAPVTKDGTSTLQKREGTLDELHGRLGFIDGIDLYNKKNAPPVKGSGNLPTKESMYRQFLIYRDFYAADAPVVICEGETDNVYLTHAIRRLAAELPELAEIDAKSKIRLKVRLYKYSQSSTARILGLNDGGSACLSSFITNYKKIISRFHAPSQAGPVVVLYDNDSGAKSIRNVIKEASKHTVKGTEPFVHVVRNMYAVPTPLLGKAQESTIEDFFDQKTRDVLVGGKSFHPGQTDFDKEIHYGKKVFAYRVVREHAHSIDFTGFRPLLKNLTLAIHAYAEPDEVDAQGA